MDWMSWLVEQQLRLYGGLLASLMVGVICSVLGTYVILQGMAFRRRLAHAIARRGACLSGGWPLAVEALGFGILAGWHWRAQPARGGAGHAIGIVFANSFAWA